jgi:glutamate-ammonia-ligase adenylyltransferase
VDETDIGKIHPGQQARVSLEAYPGRTFTGEVVKIEPQAVVEQNVTLFPVLIRMKNPEGLLKPGMNAEVGVEIASREDVVTVPNTAVVSPREAISAAAALGLDEAAVRATLRATAQAHANDDAEGALAALNESRHSLAFRIALAALAQRQPAQDSAALLAALAEEVVVAVLQIAQRELEPAHGRIDGAGFAVIGYGSVGGRELGFDSDLDLVFLHDARAEDASDGARPLEAPRYFARLAQKLVALLDTETSAGRLYEVDVRLRPDGAKGVLVSSLKSFTEYQQQRAWTWEQQALVRARPLAGSERLRAAFATLRCETLSRARDEAALRADVASMRRRMRAELDRSDAARFDLKQGDGGLVDLEFLLQERVLALASRLPGLCAHTATPALLATLAAEGGRDGVDATQLAQAHALLLARGLDCTLDRRPRLCPPDAAIDAARATVRSACLAFGLDFSPG